MIIISPLVGHKAMAAILDTALCVAEVTAALISQPIKGAIAEKAIKIRRIFALMAGKIFAFFILKKLIMLHFMLLQIPSRGIPLGDLR